MRILWQRAGREPLVHFVVLGSLLFAARAAWGGTAEKSEDRVIHLSDAFLDALDAEPGSSPADRRATFIREEVLYREGKRLGLDEGDPIVRRRVVQKMEFLLEASAEEADPDEATLERARTERAEEFMRPARTTFEHRFFSRDIRGAAAREDAEKALRRIASGPAAEGTGDPFLLGLRHTRRTDDEVARTLGPGFAQALAEIEPGGWNGPLESAYGFHLVRVTERTEAYLPPLSEIRAEVHHALREARQKEALAREVKQLIDRYRIITDADEKKGEP